MSTRDDFEMLRALAAGGDVSAAESLANAGREMLDEARELHCPHPDRVEVTVMGGPRTYICRDCGVRFRP